MSFVVAGVEFGAAKCESSSEVHARHLDRVYAAHRSQPSQRTVRPYASNSHHYIILCILTCTVSAAWQAIEKTKQSEVLQAE